MEFSSISSLQWHVWGCSQTRECPKCGKKDFKTKKIIISIFGLVKRREYVHHVKEVILSIKALIKPIFGLVVKTGPVRIVVGLTLNHMLRMWIIQRPVDKYRFVKNVVSKKL